MIPTAPMPRARCSTPTPPAPAAPSTAGSTESALDNTYTTGALWIEAHKIGGNPGGAGIGTIGCYGTVSARVWIFAQEIVGNGAQGLLTMSGNRVYIESHKLTNIGA